MNYLKKLGRNLLIIALIFCCYPAITQASKPASPPPFPQSFLEKYKDPTLSAILVHHFAPEFLSSHSDQITYKLHTDLNVNSPSVSNLKRMALLVIAQDNTLVRTLHLQLDENGDLFEEYVCNFVLCKRGDICLIEYLETELASNGLIVLTSDDGHTQSFWTTPVANPLHPEEPLYYGTKEDAKG